MAFTKPESFDGLGLEDLRALSEEALADAREILATDDKDLTIIQQNLGTNCLKKK